MEKKNTIQKVANYITKHQLIKEGQMVLVACSGGSDSMTLVDILLKLDIPISLAHCNFKLRGAESDSDEVFIKEFAKQKKLKIYLNTFDTKLYAKQQKISIEMAARKLRYDWFSDILLKNGIKIVATAHHEADKIETIILNFTKGSGLKGMQALQAKKGNVIRPLLELKKEEILAYIQDRKLLYRNDVSNLDIHFQRNRIRHEIIPNIRQINPNYSAAILQWDKIGRECEQMIQYIIDEKFKADFESNGRIDIKSLKELKFRGLILYYLLYPLGFHGDTIVEIAK